MSDTLPSRRRFLAGGLAAAATAASGCLGILDGDGPAGSDDRVLNLALYHEGGSLRSSYVVDLAETRPGYDEDAFAAARAGERYTTQHRRPFYSTPEDPKYARHDGTYYRLGSVVVDEVAEVHPVLRLAEGDEAGASDAPEAVPADQLPDVDRRAVEIAQKAARARGNEGGVPWGLVERGGYVYRREDAIDASRLLADDGPDHVVVRERVYAVDVDRERFHEPVYRATAEPVAETPERMEAILRAKFVEARFGRDDVSAGAREVLTAARGEGHAERHPYSAAFRAVLRALHERAYIDGEVRSDAFVEEHGHGIVRYDGEYYEYHLRFSTDGGVE